MPDDIAKGEQYLPLQDEQKSEINQIINQGEDQDEAARKLQQMGDAAAEELFVLLKRAYNDRRKWVRRGLIFIGLYSFLFLLILLLAIFRFRFPGHKEVGLIVKYINLCFIPGLVVYLLNRFLYASSRHNAGAQLLYRLDDVRAVGPLLQVWKHKDLGMSDQQKLAEDPLIRLLPRLRAEDVPLLDEEQRRCLYETLLQAKNPELVLAVLKALEQIGDGRALPYVEKLALGKGRMKKDRRVREAALECLPFLIERLEKERQEQTLLRPGELDGPTAVLLRPISQAGEGTEPQQNRG